MTTFAIATLGCKVNSFESESYAESLIAIGYREVDFKERADVYIINTCSVTNTAASKSRQKISQAQRANPEALICVVGCYAQTHAEELKSQLGIDILIGAGGKTTLAKRIQDALHQKGILYQTELSEIAGFEDLRVSKYSKQTRAFLKVQDGCNQFCAYCIIPYARGRERSLDPQSVVDQAIELSHNHPEIVLAGIHTGRYGKEHDFDLTALIERILHQASNLKRIRISSIEVTEITDAFIALMKSERRIARHLHIPLQSGCDATLKRMGRPYTTAEFLDRIARIRSEIPDISISTDVIVGFPGEDEEEFYTTLTTIKKAAFSFMHVFPYSKRENTRAAEMDGQNSPQCKKQRVAAVQNLSFTLTESYLASFIGKTLDVIVEQTDGSNGFGHSSEYIPVKYTNHRNHQAHDVIRRKGIGVIDGNIVTEEN